MFVRRNYIATKDELKAPYDTNCKPASISKPSNNYYFGQDLQKSDDTNNVQRAAYAVGSGTSSIGLDPRDIRINGFFPKLIDLMKAVSKVVRQESDWKHAYFNFVSVKVYYNFKDKNGRLVQKDTNWHVDVTLDKKGRPMKNNSQLPISPVAILTYGDNKSLFFRRHTVTGVGDDSSIFEIPQSSGSMFLLDGRDELLDDDNKVWRHCSGPSDGVTFSFMFRNVQKMMEVNHGTGKLVNINMTDKKKRLFDKGKKYFDDDDHYKTEKKNIDRQLDDLFLRHNR